MVRRLTGEAMKLAEKLGGIGVAVMTHRTALEVEIDNMSEALDRTSDAFAKAEVGALRKLDALDAAALRKFDPAALLAEVQKLAGEMAAEMQQALAETQAISRRMSDAMPAFRKWALGPLANQDCGSMHVANKNGDVSELPHHQPPTDLRKAAGFSQWQHDRHARED